MLTLLGVEWFAEPVEQPADRTSLQEYDVDPDVLKRWRETRAQYLHARGALIRQIEGQGWRATSRPSAYGGFVDIVMTGP